MALQPPLAREVPGSGEAPNVFEPLCAVFRRRLKAVGQKYTPERAQILDTLIRLDDLFDADQLQKTLKGKGFRVSKATIYRTLRLLLDTGIIQKVLYDSEQSHFQLAWGRRPRDLVIRIDTQEVIPVEVPELTEIRDRICRQLGLTPAGHRLQIFASQWPSEAASAQPGSSAGPSSPCERGRLIR